MKTLARFSAYFAYVVLMGLILHLLLRYNHILLEYAKVTFNRYPHQIYITVYPIFLGILFALPNFIHNSKTKGKWKFDWVKGIAIGVPTLLGSIIIWLYFSPLGMYIPLTPLLHYGTEFSTISGIVFGYTILNSFQKQKESPGDK
jgi:hypothetical protein